MLLKKERAKRCLDEAHRREARAKAKEAQRLALEERKRRREENERKAEVVVPVSQMYKMLDLTSIVQSGYLLYLSNFTAKFAFPQIHFFQVL